MNWGFWIAFTNVISFGLILWTFPDLPKTLRAVFWVFFSIGAITVLPDLLRQFGWVLRVMWECINNLI